MFIPPAPPGAAAESCVCPGCCSVVCAVVSYSYAWCMCCGVGGGVCGWFVVVSGFSVVEVVVSGVGVSSPVSGMVSVYAVSVS